MLADAAQNGRFGTANLPSSAAGDSADDKKRLGSGCDLLGQRGVGRVMRDVFLTRKKSYQGPALFCDVIADGATKRGIAGFECVEDRALRHRRSNLKLDFAIDIGQSTQMSGEYNANHGNV